MLLRLALCLFLVCPLGAAEGDRHGGDDPGAERGPARGGMQEGLVPFVLPWDDGGPGPTDLRFLNHVPAGALGRVVAGQDGHLHAGGERIRFFGVNLCFQGALPAPEDAPRIAARLAKFGVNLVRFHHIDNRRALMPGKGPSGAIDAERLDRLHRLIAALKAQGVYSNVNLLVSRSFSDADGIGPIGAVKGKMQHLIGMWHDGAFALQADYARSLLGSRNPYTGLSLAEDPAVAFVEILNENGLANTWFSSERSAFAGDLQGQPPELMAPLRRRWAAYLHERHGGGVAALEAWGLVVDSGLVLADGSIDFVPLEGFRDRPLALREDWLGFLRGVEDAYYRRMRAVLREEIGCAALLTGSTVHSSWPSVQAALDVVDSHVYWENPRWRGATWDFAGRDWHIENRSHVDAGPGGRLRWVAMGRVAGKPFSITEFNHAAPNVFAGEAPLYLAAHAAVQDWDAIYLFPYAHDDDWDSGMLMGLDVDSHPTKMANVPIAALLFRRGDLASARAASRAWMPAAEELRIAAEKGSSWNLANGFRLGLHGDDILRHRLGMVLGEQDPQLSPPPAYDRGPVLRSDTGELCWDGGDARGAVLTIDTPCSKVVLGMTAERRFVLGDWQLSVGRTRDGGGTLSVAALDGADLAHSARILVVATARAENTGMRWKEVRRQDGQGRIDWELDAWGRAPTLIEPLPGRIDLPDDGRRVRVQVLDEGGRAAGELPVLRPDPGRLAVDLGEAPSLWFLITRE